MVRMSSLKFVDCSFFLMIVPMKKVGDEFFGWHCIFEIMFTKWQVVTQKNWNVVSNQNVIQSIIQNVIFASTV